MHVYGSENPIESLMFKAGETSGRSLTTYVNSTEDLTVNFTMNDKVFLSVNITGISDIKEKPEAQVNASIPNIQFTVSYTKNGLIEFSDAKCTMR